MLQHLNLNMLYLISLRSLLTVLIAAGGVRALIAPTEIYTGNSSAATSNDTALRIATGGAGQSGLVKGIFLVLFRHVPC